MPLYEYECQECKSRGTARRTISDMNRGPICCSQMMEKRIFTPSGGSGWGDWDMNYYCPATGQGVSSAKQRKELMSRHGLADAREFDSPDFDKMHELADEVRGYKDPELPGELADAVKEQGLDNILPA